MTRTMPKAFTENAGDHPEESAGRAGHAGYRRNLHQTASLFVIASDQRERGNLLLWRHHVASAQIAVSLRSSQ